jgi:ABC-type Mn2+/Zn2+ transport system permease subunit
MTIQFSLRWLLLLTTVASVCLAIGVYFAGVMLVVVAFGLLQVATLVAADWLIRPENRRWLAMLTAASWTVVGSGFLMVVATDVGPWMAVACIFIGGVCFLLAARRWKQLTGRKFEEKVV